MVGSGGAQPDIAWVPSEAEMTDAFGELAELLCGNVALKFSRVKRLGDHPS